VSGFLSVNSMLSSLPFHTGNSHFIDMQPKTESSEMCRREKKITLVVLIVHDTLDRNSPVSDNPDNPDAVQSRKILFNNDRYWSTGWCSSASAV
jgi:hypothetical protein